LFHKRLERRPSGWTRALACHFSSSSRLLKDLELNIYIL
jgi:hypothetical protein